MLTTAPICMLNSIALLALFCIGFSIYVKRPQETTRQWHQYLAGVLLGGMAIGLMFCKIRQGDIVFDFRTVLLCLCGLFYGNVPTLTATAMTVTAVILQRLGDTTPTAAIAECTYTIAAGITGMLFGDESRNWHGSKSWKVLAITGIITQTIMLLCIYFATPDISNATLRDCSMVILLEMPIAIMLSGRIIANQINHHETLQQYHNLEDKYYKLMLCNDDIFWEIDSAGKVTYVSDNVTESLGYDRDELIGRMPHYFIDDVESIRVITEYGNNSEQAGKAYFHKNIILKHKQGYNVYCDTRCMTIMDNTIHKSSGFVCVTRNITNSHLHEELSRHNQKFIREQTIQLNNLQKGINEYKQQLADANKEIADIKKSAQTNANKQMIIISNLCDEMAPTLDDFLKYIIILRDPSQPESIRNKTLDQMFHSSEFLKMLTTDIMESTAINQRLAKISRSIENIEDVLNNICDHHNSRNTYILKKSIILHRNFTLKPDEKVIKADFQHLKRIVNIMLTNSYIFTNTGQITVECKRQSENELLISVADTGIGIPDEAYKTIFLPFEEQLLLTPARKNEIHRHTGIGLNICKSLVELMGGQIWVVSGIGKGTKISFTIPYVKASEIATQANTLYKWNNYTALVATTDRYSNILICETIAKTHINYRCAYIDGNSETLPESEYFNDYDIIITDHDAAQTEAMRTIINAHQSAHVILIDDTPNPIAICDEINQRLTQRNEN